MSDKKIESEPHKANQNSVPICIEGIGTRISAVASMIGTRKFAAKTAQISTDTLQRYIREEVHPSLGPIVVLADAADVSLSWLATGKGQMKPHEGQSSTIENDFDILESLIEEIEIKLKNADATISPDKKAVLVRLLYEEKIEGQGRPGLDSLASYLKLVS